MFKVNNHSSSSKINFSKTVDTRQNIVDLEKSNFYENINEQTFKNKKIKRALFMLSKV